MFSTCPSADDLRNFIVGDLAEAEMAQIIAHLDQCERCDVRLGELDGHSDALVAGLRRLTSGVGAATEATVPQSVVNVVLHAVQASGNGGWRDATLDPGRRLARELQEGPCRLGRFELQAELGVGSFGHVFRARDTKLDRTVALKVQRAGHFASNDEIERFLREGRSVAQLKHPGIIAIYDSGRTDDGVCYLVTEYVEGQSLAAALDSGRLDHRETARVVAEIADALQYAHEHGVVHRDVKPSNVLLDSKGHPHVMDFGLAKRDAADTMTSDGRVMGTPAYMSPEQAQGESHQVDARCDVYSLGVILYEALTGERPFQGNRRMLLLQLLEDEPRPPRKLHPEISRDLETICLKALAKSPGRRYQTAADLAADLRRLLRGETIKARPAGHAERLWRWCRRYPLAASLLVAVPLGSIVGFSYLSRLSTEFVHATALDSTRMEADMLEKINTYYSEDVVGRLDWRTTKVTHQYKITPQSLPLPFTFMIDAGQRITQDASGMQVRIYSEHPWREQGGPLDDFERRAIEELRDKTATQQDERSFHQFTTVEGKPVLRYARAQIMTESCVKCHNEHTQSPKKDWKEGDLAGVLAITRPLDRDIRRTQSGLRGAFHIMGLLVTVLALVCFGSLWTARRRGGSGMPRADQ